MSKELECLKSIKTRRPSFSSEKQIYEPIWEPLTVNVLLKANSQHSTNYEEPITIHIRNRFIKQQTVPIQSEETTLFSNQPIVPVLKPGALSALTSNLFSVCLKECFENLDLFKRIMNVPLTSPVTIYQHKRLKDRFGTAENKSELMPQTNLTKMRNDLLLIDGMLQSALDDIDSSGGFKTFEKCIRAILWDKKDEKDLIDLYYKKLDERSRLEKEVAANRVRQLQNEIEKSDDLFELAKKLDRFIETGELENLYIDEWEKARNFQNWKRNSDIEEKHKKSKEYYSTKMQHENRIHREIEIFLEDQKQKYLNEIDLWMNNYETEIEELDEELIRFRERKDAQSTKFQKLSYLYEMRQKEMDEYLEQKAERQECERIKNLRISAAEKIQRWWRRVMFIWKLGPYAPKKGKKPKKGKGKKK